MRPYLGVLPLVLRARKSAFSAPRIWTVEAGYLAKLVREPLMYRQQIIDLCFKGRKKDVRMADESGSDGLTDQS